ncbi:MAG TPA: hypothetical protein ENJ10_00475 [Caldithrix abyssi]|uniref:DUF5683 domain-containing protein n=1 Tax=Caldithrix abyssi TaxID=187145 RepID=A0A7V1PU12_CALAY|nr:hypothetical protein [Caldithrix abyssi]
MSIAGIKKYIALILLLSPFLAPAQNPDLGKKATKTGYEWQLTDALPGLAQLHQERFVKSALLYGGAWYLYGSAAGAYNRYRQNGLATDRDASWRYALWGAAWHGLGLLDGWYYGRHYRAPKRELYSDTPLKSPWGAAMRSLFFPGWGQWYNESYYKAVFYFGLTTAVGYTVYHNDRLYRETGAETYKDQRSRYFWYLGLNYLFMVLDAQVDAWLFKFDEVARFDVYPGRYDGTLMFKMEFSF